MTARGHSFDAERRSPPVLAGDEAAAHGRPASTWRACGRGRSGIRRAPGGWSPWFRRVSRGLHPGTQRRARGHGPGVARSVVGRHTESLAAGDGYGPRVRGYSPGGIRVLVRQRAGGLSALRGYSAAPSRKVVGEQTGTRSSLRRTWGVTSQILASHRADVHLRPAPRSSIVRLGFRTALLSAQGGTRTRKAARAGGF